MRKVAKIKCRGKRNVTCRSDQGYATLQSKMSRVVRVVERGIVFNIN